MGGWAEVGSAIPLIVVVVYCSSPIGVRGGVAEPFGEFSRTDCLGVSV